MYVDEEAARLMMQHLVGLVLIRQEGASTMKLFRDIAEMCGSMQKCSGL